MTGPHRSANVRRTRRAGRVGETRENVVKATKGTVQSEIVAILERATTPHCADKMYQKLRAAHRGWPLDSDTVFKWMKQLADAGRIANIGYVGDEHEKTMMFMAKGRTE